MSEPKEFSDAELRAIDQMPANEYRAKLSDPEFCARVNRLPAPPVAEAPPEVEPVAEVVEPVESVVPVEIAAELPAPVELLEKRYTYQPTDDLGRPMGGAQVIKYKNDDELATKLVEQNVLLQRKLREVTRKQQLGITDEIQPSADVEFQDIMELKPRVLSAEERFTLSQDIQDPAKSVEAANKLFEAANGMSAAQMCAHLNKQQNQILQITARQNYDIFEAAQKDKFYPCQENKQVLTDWMVKKGLNPTVASFELALSHLSTCGLLVDRPIVREAIPAPVAAPVVVPVPVTEPNPQVPVVAESRITPEAQPQKARQARVPSSLNNFNSSDASPALSNVTLSSSDVAKMSADEYKVKLRDPKFRAMVDELDRQAFSKRTGRNA